MPFSLTKDTIFKNSVTRNALVESSQTLVLKDYDQMTGKLLAVCHRQHTSSQMLAVTNKAPHKKGKLKCIHVTLIDIDIQAEGGILWSACVCVFVCVMMCHVALRQRSGWLLALKHCNGSDALLKLQ